MYLTKCFKQPGQLYFELTLIDKIRILGNETANKYLCP